MESEHKSKKHIGIITGVVVIVAIILVTIFMGRKPAEVPVVEPTENPVISTPIVPSDTTNKLVYKDGTYSATGSYISPGGPDKIAVTLTLKNDIITDISATPMPGDNTSAKYQAKFLSGYKALVIGKNISDVYLTKVSGSSLTPKGFNDAIAQIKSQAQA